MDSERETDPMVQLILSGAEKFLVSRTWNSDFDASFDLAISIYEHLFTIDPSIASLFPTVNIATLDLRGNKTFSRMAMRLVRVLTTAVQNLNDQSRLDLMLYQLGIIHRQFISRGLKEHHWDTMNLAMKMALSCQIEQSSQQSTELNSDQIRDAINAWGKIIDYITRQIKSTVYEVVADENEIKCKPPGRFSLFCGFCS